MKKFYLTTCTLIAFILTAAVSCNKYEPYDDTELKEQITALDQRIKALEELNDVVEGLQEQIDGIHTLQFQITDDNEIIYSLDGGVTWVSTGVFLPEMPEIPEAEDCLVESVVDNGSYITFILSDGSTFDVEKVEVVKFEILSGKQFFNSLETKKIPVDAKGMGTAMVAKIPKGWEATYYNGELSVTAPNEDDAIWEEIGYEEVCTNMDFSGTIEVWAVGDDSKIYVGSVGVALAECGTKIEVGSDYNTVKFTFADRSWNTTATYYGASFKEDFDPQAIVEKVLAYNTDGINSNEDPMTYDFIYEVNTTIEALAGKKPVPGDEVIVWALETTYDSNYNLNMTKDDFIRVFVNPIDVQFEATPSFCDADLSIKVIGTNSFYGLAMDASYYDPTWFNIQEYINPSWGPSSGYTYKSSSYSGKYSEFGQDPAHGMINSVYQDSDYYVIIVPLVPGKALSEYTNDDCLVFEFTTTEVQEGGSSTATFGDPTIEMDYAEVAGTTDGFLTYYVAFTEGEIEANGLTYDDAFIIYLIDPANYMVSSTKESSFEAYAYGNPGEKVVFAALPIDADGKYGKLAKLETSFKAIEYSSAISLAIDEDATKVGVDYIDLKLDVTGTPAKYVVYTPYWPTDNPAEHELDMSTAYEGAYGYQFFTAEDVVDGYLRVSDLTTGEETQILIIAFDENGQFTPVVEYIGTPTLPADAVVTKDAANWSAISYAVFSDEECTSTEIISRYFTDIYIQIAKSESASTVYIAKQYNSSMNNLDAAGSISKLLAASSKTAIAAEDWDENGHYVKYFSLSEDESAYIFWCDADGKYYEPVKVEYESVPAE